MKKTLVLLALAVLLPSLAGAEVVVITRRTTFPKFGEVRSETTVSRAGRYRHSKTVRENAAVVPYRYQVGFRQRDLYREKPDDYYRMRSWR